MDIVTQMESLKQRFDEVQKLVTSKQQELVELVDEQKRMQGEYRLLLQMGIDQGILDNRGNPVVKEGEVSGDRKDS